jgi:hypothetical protein
MRAAALRFYDGTMASAETSLKYGSVRPASEPVAPARVPPFPRVLIELLAKRWNGTLVIRADGGEHEAAIRFEDGFAVAARVDAPSATLLQCMIPLCAWAHKGFEFFDREDVLGSESGVVHGQVDPLGLITAAVRGPVREEVLEEAMTALGDEQFRLRPTTVLARYGFTAQELHAVACLQRGSINMSELRTRAQVPEHQIRRVIYVLWATHALTLVGIPRRALSGTIRHAAPPPLPTSISGQELSPLELPPVPGVPAELKSDVTVEIPNVDEHVRASSVPPHRQVLNSDVAPVPPKGRYHVQNPNNGVNAVDARVRSIPPVIEALLRATNRPRPSSMPVTQRSIPPRAQSRSPIDSPAREIVAREIQREPGPEVAREIAREQQRDQAREPTPSAHAPTSKLTRTPTRPPEHVVSTSRAPEAANPTRSLKPTRDPGHTRSLKPVRPSSPPVTNSDRESKPTRSLKPAIPSSPTASRPPAIPSSPAASRPPSTPGMKKVSSLHPRAEGDVHATLAEGLMRRGDYTAAVLEMQEAMKIRGPRSGDEAMYAWMLYQQVGAPPEVPEACWNAIERAFRLDLHSDVAYHYKAMLLKREGRLAEARAHFRRALHLNPRNVDARRELRVLLMRKRENTKPSQGILNKLFGKTPAPK